MDIPRSLLDPETYSPWTNLHSVGLNMAWSCAHAGFLNWASNLPQLRDLERDRTPRIRRGVIIQSATRRTRRRRTPRHVRRFFIWGFMGVNAAVTAAWSYVAGEAITAATAAAPSFVAGPKAANIFSRLFPNVFSLLFHYEEGANPHRSVEIPPLMGFMVNNLALSRRNLRQGRWWTLLTCGVSHAAPGHLLVNMCEFYVWASRCFDLGVGVVGVSGLMFGSAVWCSLASVLGEDARLSGLHFGGSGIVCGLQAAAILLEPVMRFRIRKFDAFRYYIVVTLLTGCTGDLVGLLLQRLELAAPSLTRGGSHDRPQKMIGYSGHLGGTTFGVVYWYFWLRTRFGTW